MSSSTNHEVSVALTGLAVTILITAVLANAFGATAVVLPIVLALLATWAAASIVTLARALRHAGRQRRGA